MSFKEFDKSKETSIAVIGMECFFPKASRLKAYWRLIFRCQDAIMDIPATHWAVEDYFDPDPKKPDHVYCKRGGFLDPIPFDPTEFGIPPAILEATDSSQLIGLMAAKAALEDAGYGGNHQGKDRTSVILGVTGTQELVIPLSSRLGHPIWRKALAGAGVDRVTTDEVIRQLSDAYVSWQENSFPGLLGNVVAGRISNRLDLAGTNCVVDAACASSLSAVHMSIMELLSGRNRMVVTGGVDTLNDIFMHMCFSKTSVLSPTGDSRPFSKYADGTVLGEGVGILVLKRLDDAIKDNDRIYALIKGMGTSSDGKSQSIYAPSADGQIKALKNAYQSADVDPLTVGLIEAHGTGTQVGDEVEFAALNHFFAQSPEKRRALGSVKSMIGHTKAAAGAAGLIKTILSLYNKILPPTLKAEEPDPNLNLQNSSFYLNSSTRPWFSEKNHPRRAGVSAFGFGGSNFHAVLEEYEKVKKAVSWDGSVEIVALSADTPDDLKIKCTQIKADFHSAKTFDDISLSAALSRTAFSVNSPYRLLWVLDRSASALGDDSNLSQILDNLITHIDANPENPEIVEKNVFFGGPKKPGKIAFIFPGQGAQYVDMAKDLTCIFPQLFDVLEKANALFDNGSPLTDFIYPVAVSDKDAKKNHEAELTRTDRAQPAIGGISLGMLKILHYFGLAPDAACGHSFGELVALNAAGWINDDTLIKFAVNRGKLMAAAGMGNDKDPGTMTAVKAPLEDLDKLIRNSDTGVILANRNNPNQGVLSGPTEAIEKAEKLCKDNGYKTIRLTVAAAFHSHLMKDAQRPFMEIVKQSPMTPTNIPVYSNTLGGPYPTDPEQAKKILGEQILCPVDFVNDIKNLNASGAVTFLEVGPKTVLSGLVKAILEDKDVNIIALDGSGGKQSGIWDLATALCKLAALGYPVLIDRWEDGGSAFGSPKKPKMEIMISGTNYRSRKNPPLISENKKMPLNQAGALMTKAPPAPSTSENETSANITANRDKEAKYFVDHYRTTHATGPTQPHQSPSSIGNYCNNINGFPQASKKKTTDISSDFAIEAFKTVAEGLKSMQALQQQTTRAHEKFLESQMESNRTLQMMIQSTQRLVENTLGRRREDEHESSFSTATSSKPSAGVHADLNINAMDMTDKPIGQSISPSVGEDRQHENQTKDGISRILLATVSELTGYPVEMLGLDLDIEADLGIDSIKRVEILSVMEEKIPGLPQVEPEIMGTLKTLQQIIEYLLSKSTPFDTPNSINTESTGLENATIPENIAHVLLATVSELTGYPVEMLGLDLDIEADLGIDSIKRVEILSVMEEKIPGMPQVEPEIMGTLKTLQQIIEYLSSPADDLKGRLDQKNCRISDIAYEIAGPKHQNPDSITSEADEKCIDRQTISYVSKPFTAKKPLIFPNKKKIYVLDEPAGLSLAIKHELESRGFVVVLFSPDLLSENDALKDAGGLILVSDFTATNSSSPTDYDAGHAFLKNALIAAKQAASGLNNAAKGKGVFFATVSRLDGAFGFKCAGVTSPITGGLAGLAKTAAIEWPDVLCRCLDISPDWDRYPEIAAAIADELLYPDKNAPMEIGLGPNERNELAYNKSPYPEGILDLGPNDTVLVTGGARGVTAAAAFALARATGSGFALLGRSPEPFVEPEWLGSLTHDAQMKKAILEYEFSGQAIRPVMLEKRFKEYAANREIRDTLECIRSHGAQADYYSADVCDRNGINTVCEGIRKKFGRISAIVHGAGVLEDRLIQDKSIEQFNRVFHTKVMGLFNLMDATQNDSLKYLVLFSSIAARTGNKGQVDYAMANEALNKCASQISFARPGCRVVSINWGPWDGGMVNAALKKEFSRNHIDLIPPSDGAQSMIMEMKRGPADPVEVILGGPVSVQSAEMVHQRPVISVKKSAKDVQKNLSVAFERTIDMDAYPILKSHVLNGIPVVPFALMTEWFGHGALHENPGLIFHGFDDMRVLSGIKINKETTTIRLLTGKVRRNNGFYEVDLEIRNGENENRELVHARAKAILADKFTPPPSFDRTDLLNSNGYGRSVSEIYENILFHGLELQGMKEVRSLNDNGMVARIVPAPAPDIWMKNPLRNKWVGDPLILDSAFQMASLWCFEKMGNVSLPVYSKGYRQYIDRFPKDMVTLILEVTQFSHHKMKGDFTFLDSKNSVIARMTGFEAVVDESLYQAFKPDCENCGTFGVMEAAG